MSFYATAPALPPAESSLSHAPFKAIDPRVLIDALQTIAMGNSDPDDMVSIAQAALDALDEIEKQPSTSALVEHLVNIRDTLPIPAPGSPEEILWAGAMAEPLGIADYVIGSLPALMQKAAADAIEAGCANIKAADDASAENDYMLDSDDCIKVLRKQWQGPALHDQPKQLGCAHCNHALYVSAPGAKCKNCGTPYQIKN